LPDGLQEAAGWEKAGKPGRRAQALQPGNARGLETRGFRRIGSMLGTWIESPGVYVSGLESVTPG